MRRQTYTCGYLPSRTASPPFDRQAGPTKLYCLVTEAHVCEQLAQGGNRTRDLSVATRKSNSLGPLHYQAAHTFHLNPFKSVGSRNDYRTSSHKHADKLSSPSQFTASYERYPKSKTRLDRRQSGSETDHTSTRVRRTIAALCGACRYNIYLHEIRSERVPPSIPYVRVP